MDHEAWDTAVEELTKAADVFAVLSRCLSVAPQLAAWRETHEQLAGMDAANALDQARGDLERLVAGNGSALLERVGSILNELPTPWE